MDSKNYTDVLINGKIYTLGGAEEESYLQQVASYINEKMSGLQRQPGFQRQSDDYKSVMTCLNLADDYFKDELVSTQMKLEALHRETEELRRQMKEMMLRIPEREEAPAVSETAREAELEQSGDQNSLEG